MGHVWEMPDGKMVARLQQRRAIVDTSRNRWNIYMVFAPGTSTIFGVCHGVRNGRVLIHGASVHFMAEWESSKALPTIWDRAEAECLLMQVLVDWFGVDVTQEAWIMFSHLPLERASS